MNLLKNSLSFYNLICFLCGLCVSLRLSALKGPLTQRTQRYAEGRRGKTSISTRFFVQSPPDVLNTTSSPRPIRKAQTSTKMSHRMTHSGHRHLWFMKHLIALLILLSITLGTIAPVRAQQQQQPAPDDVVRITTNLVQIDAVVTDKSGNQIKDLVAGDFEVLQDGKPQKIVSVSYINTEVTEQTDLAKRISHPLHRHARIQQMPRAY